MRAEKGRYPVPASSFAVLEPDLRTLFETEGLPMTRSFLLRSIPKMLALGLAVCASALTMSAHDARACGGCFHSSQPSQVVTVITDHRMVFSISTTQTVLWDQIRYGGNPLEFAWVLPVKKGTRVELSRDAWLAALDASSQTIITGPSLTCGGTTGGVQDENDGDVGCGAAASASAPPPPGPSSSGYAGSDSQVQIVGESTVGPYETVTLESSNPMALETWLGQNGFDLPASFKPTVAAYVSDGFDFLALKLQPGEGVRAMQPVRIVTPGADPTLPLRMVAAGVGANVGIELYVISEGRYHPQNFPDAQIDFTQLTWDRTQNQSNYETLATAAMAASGGQAWLTEFAGQPQTAASGLTLPLPSTNGVPVNPGLADAYFNQCTKYPALGPCGSDAAAPGSDASAADAAVEAGARDGSSEASADAAADTSPATPACPMNPPDSCEYFDDLDVALTGLHPGDVWLTRIRAFLPASALSTGDLKLEASPVQTPVSNSHHAATFSDGYNPCSTANATQPAPAGTSSGCACDTASPRLRTRMGTAFLVAVTLLGVSLAKRRKQRLARQ
jgi:hypothetical protein